MTAPSAEDEIPFADTPDDVLYVKLSHTGIPPVIACVDSLPVVTFDGDPTPYMTVDSVIAWYEKERDNPVHAEMITTLKDALELYRTNCTVRGVG